MDDNSKPLSDFGSHQARQSNGNVGRMLFAFVVTVSALCIFLVQTAPPEINDSNRTLGILLIITALVPTYLYVMQYLSGSAGFVPFFPLICVSYAFYLGFPIFSSDVFWLVPPWTLNTVLDETVMYAILGIIMLIVGFYALKLPFKVVLPRANFDIRSDRAPLFGFLMVSTGEGLTFLRQVVSIPLELVSLVDVLNSFALIGIALLFILQLDNRLSKTQTILLDFGVIPFHLLTLFGNGAVTPVALTILILGSIYWSQKRSIPFIPVALAMIVLLFIRGVGIGEFRRQVQSVDAPQLSPVERGTLLLTLTYDRLILAPDATVSEAQSLATNRIGYINTFAYVVNVTPSIVPFWDGGSYSNLVLGLIPRLVWPDKPSKSIGQDFGHRYDLLGANDSSTSYNLPYLIEFFINFGWPGVMVGMFLVGAFYQVLDSLLNWPGEPSGTLLIGLIVFFSIFSIESDLSLVFGNVLTRLGLYIVILHPILYSNATSNRLGIGKMTRANP